MSNMGGPVPVLVTARLRATRGGRRAVGRGTAAAGPSPTKRGAGAGARKAGGEGATGGVGVVAGGDHLEELLLHLQTHHNTPHPTQPKSAPNRRCGPGIRGQRRVAADSQGQQRVAADARVTRRLPLGAWPAGMQVREAHLGCLRLQVL